ncbi:hypothetical protein VTO42DRAFT_5369 [Malbranchea cinnamomea]
MPREKQKRGRRAEAQRKAESKRKHEEEASEPVSKRLKTANPQDNAPRAALDSQGNIGDDYIALEGTGTTAAATDNDNTPFYGLLDADEQEYFSHASQTLELNQFESDEDRRLFIDSVYEEANGKELKIACSQSCSRLMEKLITLSTPAQAKRLFQKFSGNFLHLSQHRFASHCCECLYLRAAPIVTHEMSKAKKKKKKNDDNEGEGEDSDAIAVPMEDLFLQAISELEGNWGYLLTEPFASHTIRVLLLVLAGEPFDTSTNTSILASRKKENLDSVRASAQIDPSLAEKRAVPQSFKDALEKMIKNLVGGLDGTYLRALTTHPVGSPVLQVLLTVELSHMGRARAKDPDSVLRRLVPDESLEEQESQTFLSGLLFDPVGSRLLETIIRCAPGKFFKLVYKKIIRDRIGALSRNELAAYVIVRVLERLSKEDLEDAMDRILPEMQILVDRSRVIVIKSLIERSRVRGVDTTRLADALNAAYGSDPAIRLVNMLKLNDDEQEDKAKAKSGPSPQQVHGSLLAQAMLQALGPLADSIRSSLVALSTEHLLKIAMNSSASHVLQESLVFSKSTAQYRRQIAPRFSGHMHELALDASGSHVADALWHATTDIMFIKQRLADELLENELALRDSFFGRAVWRNWFMDLYKRKRGDWMAKAKGLNNNQSKADEGEQAKSKLDLARERFAASLEQQAKLKQRKGGVANSNAALKPAVKTK